MKTIIMESITLHNWRGEKDRTTVFHTDAPTYICGDNGLGKSRHFDAFCWLLFGKDSQNRADYELRTYDAQHQPLHHCECSVEATLTIDGEELTLKREWYENWVKPKGQPEEVFKNNETRCLWNGTPVTKTEYGKRVEDVIINDSLFKMITNPHYFPVTMKWQQQRQALLDMAGTKSDHEIAADDANFKALLDELSGKSLSDFRKEIASTKKKLKEEADKIPTRIDEVQHGMPEAEDWESLSDETKTKKHDIEQIDAQLQDSAARDEAKRKERDDINQKIDKARNEQYAIIRKAKAEAQEKADKQNEYRRGLEASLKRAYQELSEATIDQKRNAERIKYLEDALKLTDKLLDELRKEWYDINSTVYDDTSDICPCCGQRLPEDKIAEAHTKFAEQKKEQLAANNEKGKSLSAQKKSLADNLEQKKAETELLKSKVETADTGVKKFTDAVMATPTVAVEDVCGEKIPAWVALQQKIDELNSQLNEMNVGTTDDNKELQNLKDRKSFLLIDIEGLNKRLAKRTQIDDANKRIAELNARGKELAQQIADIEKREFIAAQFSKKKIEDCEQRIKGMFKTVRFKLFDYTQDGNEYECCVPLVNGVPYPVANTASQINAGLDIINTLCKFYNVSAPIFIDGAESVNHYTETQSQTIFLEVTDDKELIVK